MISVDSINTMWCQNCGQDVPGVSADGAGEYRCPRCRKSLRQGDSCLRIGGGGEHPGSEDANLADVAVASVENTDVEGETSSRSAPPAAPYDGWELEQRLKHVERMLAAEGLSVFAEGNGKPGEKHSVVLRRDSAHARLAMPHGRARSAEPSIHGKLSSTVVWGTLLIGVTALACGSFLVGWSMLSARDDLWSIGLPIGLAGGVNLLVSLIVQLDRFLHDNRLAAARLEMVDSQLHRLADAANRLGEVNRHSPSDAFYSHFVGGANPQLLLSDLKSQLDLLAVKIGQGEMG